MSISLYDITVASYLQIIASSEAILEKARAHFLGAGRDPEEIAELRLVPDMQPFRFQIVSMVHHSVGAIDAVRSGTFVPFGGSLDLDYGALQALISQARLDLAALTPEQIDVLAGRDVVLRHGEVALPFTTEGFLISLSLPNFFFHAVTAYDILRHAGVPLGKRDFVGALKLKRGASAMSLHEEAPR